MKPAKPASKPNITAIILSALFPGTGQLYNGDKAKGFLFLFLWIVLEFVYNILPENVIDIIRGEVTLDLSLYLRFAFLGGFRLAVVIDADRVGRRKASESEISTNEP